MILERLLISETKLVYDLSVCGWGKEEVLRIITVLALSDLIKMIY